MAFSYRSGRVSPRIGPSNLEMGDHLEVFSYYRSPMARAPSRPTRMARSAAEEADALMRVVREISSELELRPLLTRIVEYACELLGADDGSIGLYDPTLHLMRVEAIYNMPREELGSAMAAGRGLAGAVLATDGVIAVPRYGDLPGASIPRLAENAVLGMPIRGRGRLLGFFGIGARPPRKFDAQDIATLEKFASHAAIAIDNALSYRRERQRSERMALIAKISRLVAEPLEPAALAERAAQVIHDQLGYPNVVIPLLESTEEGQVLVYRAHAGAYRDVFAREYRQPADRGITGAALRERRAQLVNDVRSDPRYLPPPLPIDVECELAVPIVHRSEAFGVVNIESREPFDADDLASIQIISDTLGVALKNARLYGEARRAAVLRERQRLARDLHDSVSQLLSSINMLSQSLPAAVRKDPLEGERRAQRIDELARLAFAEMRALLRELKPALLPESSAPTTGSLDDLREYGLPRALVRMARMLAPETPDVSIELGEFPPQHKEHEEAIFRICQEALSNAIRHSGAQQVRIEGEVREHSVRLVLEDDGQGFDVEEALSRPASTEGGLGLTTMQERARALQGSVTISAAPGRGTRLTVELPRSDR
jgi:signal transduction histidine kinase